MGNLAIFKSGSEWRKWDLHIHTPETKKSDNFKGSSVEEKWENYINTVNSSYEEISVIGITDYFCIDNYFKFKSYVSNGKITKKFDLILPNIELRMLPSARKAPINIHCIFNPIIDRDISERFLSKLTFSYKDSSYSATTDSLIRLGKTISPNSELTEFSAKIKGIEQFVIEFESLKTIFKNDPDLKKNTLILVSNNDSDGNSGHTKNTEYRTANGSQLDATRENIYNFSDAILSSNPSDRIYFLGKGTDDEKLVISKYGSLKPCFHGSDAHDLDRIFKADQDRFCWIKSDPTFEGLKQVLYEPEERVIIQQNKPQEKTGYQVIDSIEIKSNDIYNPEILFNQNLNTIIGGRSSGKSILLGSIAKKLKTIRVISESKIDYFKYIEPISQNIKVIWKDGAEDYDREVEYFEQGYMNEIVFDKLKFEKIIKDVLIQRGKENILEENQSFVLNNTKEISNSVNEYYQQFSLLGNKVQKSKEKGDKLGIESEIKKLELEISKLSETRISFQEKEKYESIKKQIEENSIRIQQLSLDYSHLEKLLKTELFKDNLDYEIEILSDLKRNDLKSVFKNIRDETILKWQFELEKLKNSCMTEVKKISKINEEFEKDETFLKVKSSFDGYTSLSELQDKLDIQRTKLNEITNLQKEIDILLKRVNELKISILKKHRLFYDNLHDVVLSVSDSIENLSISAKNNFDNVLYNEMISLNLNLSGSENKRYRDFKFTDYESFEIQQSELLDKLVNNTLTLKSGINNLTFASNLLSTSFFNLTYDIEYEGDEFDKMSDGKKAFVILKLLLEFSNKQCPILIDQPEDDLDNRAIYNELVTYLRKKKKDRQIILVTHNPNIVVGADSELIICANQHGSNSINSNEVKFQYISGSLENTFPKNDKISEVLNSQGIREHVCEILEGGTEAFKKREKKYSI